MKIISLSLVIGATLILSSCGPKLEEEVVSQWPNGAKQKVQFFLGEGDDKVKVKEVRYYMNGQKELEGEYLNGKKQGIWVAWFEDGTKQSEGSYKDDLRDGLSTVWRENGFTYYEGNYSMGKLHGTWIFYDLDGSRMKEVLFEHDQKINEIDFTQEAKR